MPAVHSNSVADVVRRHWGFDTLRPLQHDAIAAALAGRDALVVLPTGGGKSLCYQAPPLITGRLTLVVSPLIALMQDQVAALRLAGVNAAALHGHASATDIQAARDALRAGDLRLLFAAPERVMSSGFLSWLASAPAGLGAIAIDESHCISQWGHDFRPEYRRLAELRRTFPNVPLHAFTATATPRVRRDILDQLKLRDPVELVGSFDRPNLTYRVVPRNGGWIAQQIAIVIRRHAAQGAAIVYCITRKETEQHAEDLRHLGIPAESYHAGMDKADRDRIASDFRDEKLNVVVATVAFGMGIDRSDVRTVIHTSMPQTVEHYQQETGRAGRDGLPAECVMFYAAGDVERWKQILSLPNTDGSEKDPALIAVQMELVRRMQRLAGGIHCRHRALAEYFGQQYDKPDCGACDTCLGDHRTLPDGNELARKILSCVARVKERFGAGHVADVLLGKSTEKAIQYRHLDLSTFGLLRGMKKTHLMAYINQLVDLGALERTDEEFSVLKLNELSWAIMRGTRTTALIDVAPAATAPKQSVQEEAAALSADEAGLFEALRKLRRELADSMAVPPYVVFSDATLVGIVRRRPSTAESLLCVPGVGQKKIEQFGEIFLAAVRDYCAAKSLTFDVAAPLPAATASPKRPKRVPPDAAALFAKGMSLDEAAAALNRARSTTAEYLAVYITEFKPESIDAWIDRATQERIAEALRDAPDLRLKPIHEKLNAEVSYDAIRIVVNHIESKRATQ